MRESSQASSTDQIRVLLELSAQEEVERMMKVLEAQQGGVLRLLMNLDSAHKDNLQLKAELASQYASTAAKEKKMAPEW